MKLALSNLAFPGDDRATAYRHLAAIGVGGIEIAPTRIAPWDRFDSIAAREERTMLGDAGLVASSMQAIFFGHSDMQLIQDEARFVPMEDHVEHLSSLAGELGATVAVFGAPRNRLPDGLTPDEAWAIGIDRLRRLGMAAESGGPLIIGMEPVPAHYGGVYLASAADVTAMVEAVDHPRIRVHLDTGCVSLGGDDIGVAIHAAAATLTHFHAAEPDLGRFEMPLSPHACAAEALSGIGYDRWVSIEMREVENAYWPAIDQAVAFVRDTYTIDT